MYDENSKNIWDGEAIRTQAQKLLLNDDSTEDKIVSFASEMAHNIICLINELGEDGSLYIPAWQRSIWALQRDDVLTGDTTRRVCYDVNDDPVPTEAIWTPENLWGEEPSGRDPQFGDILVKGASDILCDLATTNLALNIEDAVRQAKA